MYGVYDVMTVSHVPPVHVLHVLVCMSARVMQVSGTSRDVSSLCLVVVYARGPVHEPY